MYFNTIEYYGFFLVTWLFARYGPNPGFVLLLASMLFYVVAGWFDTALISALISLNWLLVRYVSELNRRMVLAVAINIGALFAVKYRVFLGGSLSGDAITYVDVVLPLGISFYTFQLLAYQVDAARDPALREQDPRPFALFVILFPQLIAGPIVRAAELMPQIRRLFSGNPRRLRLYSYGLFLCVLGLTKKIIFADSLAPIVDDIFFLGPADSAQAWLGAWLFTFQIYFDFSGYSDIAIGCAYLLGIRLPRNFRTPYLSRSPREFWRRWHITLSTWIRDYLYIPLGGGRGSQAQQLAILMLVMGVAGLWHGAGANFVVWGVLWGAYIGAHRIAMAVISRSALGVQIINTRPAVFVLWSGHLLAVVLLWVFFRAGSWAAAIDYLCVMFSASPQVPALFSWTLSGCLLLLASHVVESKLERARCLNYARRWNNSLVWGLLAGLALWLVVLPSYTHNPFIYFRF
ncbi:MAG: alginate O-acetyltransferase complex protein AlgI [Gammaproteobacteria bacterium]|jgi:alginate O-acetyltransferase complex protein AlgI